MPVLARAVLRRRPGTGRFWHLLCVNTVGFHHISLHDLPHITPFRRSGTMKIGTIGAGNIGGTLARLWTTAGHEVLISSRHPDQLADLAAQIGDRCCYGTAEEAVTFGEVVLLSPPLGAIVELAPKIADLVAGKVVLDTMNPFPDRDGEPANEILRREIPSAQATQERLPHARIVRAFSSVHYADLQS
ncbi:MAG: hypothetical protein GF331_06680, partial [Chitinivibrionales bacterium]|nr:hypothetical protein [Chitinivibrionales bacterium]